MRQTRNNQVTLLILAAVVSPCLLSLLWLSVASPEQLAHTSRGIFVGVAVLSVFIAGVAVGGFLSRRRARGVIGPGYGEGGERQPPAPDSGTDPVEEELQRLIAEERSKRL